MVIDVNVVVRKLWAKGYTKVYGLADHDNMTIEIDPRQNSKQFLDTLVHEVAHLFFPEASESKIRDFANTVTHIAWEKGYRRIQE